MTSLFLRSRRSLLSATAMASLLSLASLPGTVLADGKPFDKAAFDKLLAEGKPVVVDFYADWCPTCKTQKSAVSTIMKDAKFKDLTVLVADYDKEKDLKKSLRVSSQSTFVVFKAGKEVARSTGQTKPDDIAATFAKAL